MLRKTVLGTLLWFVFLSLSSQAQTSVPSVVRYSGRIAPEYAGNTVHLTFSVYADENTSVPVWTETHKVKIGPTGSFSVFLGSTSQEGLPPEMFSAGEARWIDVAVEGAPPEPRARFISVPFSYVARDTELFGGLPPSAYLGCNSSCAPAISGSAERSWASSSGTKMLADTAASGTSGALAKYLDGTNLGPSMALESSSGIGIGVVPTAKLDVAGRSKFRGTGLESAGFYLSDSAGNGNTFIGLSGTGSGDGFGLNRNGDWQFTVNALGNVGIGVGNAYERLEVRGRGKFSNDGVNTAGFWFADQSGRGGAFLGSTGPSSFDDFGVWHGDAWRLTVSSRGNIGIGTAYAYERLEVRGRAKLISDNENTAGLWFAESNGNGGAFVGMTADSTTAPLGVWRGGGWKVLINDKGMVSFGESEPALPERLNVDGRLLLRTFYATGPGIWFGTNDPSRGTLLGTLTPESGSPVGIWHGGQWRLSVASNGYVGIGTSSPTATLEVQGDVKLSGGSLIFADGSSQSTAAAGSGTGTLPDAAVTTDKLNDAAVTDAKLADGAVTTNKLAPGAVDATKLTDWSVETAKIADAAVTASKIADLAIASSKVADGAITTSKIADAAITTVKLAPGSVDSSKLSESAILTLNIAEGAITSAKLAAGGVDATRLADASVQTSKIADASIITSKIVDAAITSAKLAEGSVTTTQLADGSVTAAKLAPGSIIAATLGSNAFTGTQTAQVSTDGDPGFKGVSTSSTGIASGVVGESFGSGGTGVSGTAHSATGEPVGVRGLSKATAGIGVRGEANHGTGITYGVYGVVPSKNGFAIYGRNSATTGPNFAIYGVTEGDGGSAGVKGEATKSTAAATTQYGVFGKAAGPSGVGVAGVSTSTFGGTIGVQGQVYSSGGVAGQFANNITSGTGNVIVAKAASGIVWRVDTNGNTYAKGTNNVGSADFAEAIQTASDSTSYTPGDVIIIDPSVDRRVSVCSQPYATNVIGIYATKPGILAAPHDGGLAFGEIPVAMIGIVPAKASAENGAIRRGDLLVSASVPGHVMKGTDRTQMLGAVVGKAMQELESGTGMIEMAVTLQ